MNPTIFARLDAYAHDSAEADRMIAELHARIAELEAERDSYREVACAALDQLHATTETLKKTQTQLYRALEERRLERPQHRSAA